MKTAHLARALSGALLIACSGAETAPAAAPQTASAGSAAVNATNAAPAVPATSMPASGAGAMAAEWKPTEAGRPLVIPALEPGFQRFIAPPIEVKAESSDDWMQWVFGPTDADYDVVAIRGGQSSIGHHALLLATTEANPVGFTRVWTERDQLNSRSMGGIGAEGAVPIPDGVVIRIKKGSYFALQTHYLNASTKPVMGETYVDLKLGPPDPTHRLASSFASTSLTLSITPQAQTSMDLRCKIQKDLSILRMTNHMHHYGVSTFTEYTDPAGKTQMLKRDAMWSEDWALAPNYDYFPVEKPLVIPAGSEIHTRCIWNNTTPQPITFPTEMCVFATLILGDNDISCIDGAFRESNSDPTAAAPSAPSAPSAGSAGAGAAMAAAAGAPSTSATGACLSAGDKAIVQAADYTQQMRSCGIACLGGTETCAAEWLAKNTTLTPPCATCEGARITCAMSHCINDCTAGFMSPGCTSCIETSCGAPYHACSGL